MNEEFKKPSSNVDQMDRVHSYFELKALNGNGINSIIDVSDEDKESE